MAESFNERFLQEALRLARRGYGTTSPNPMVGAVLVKGGKIIGRGWHRRAGLPHAEIEALHDAEGHGHNPEGATLYVTLEPCCTHGRTLPCTGAIVEAGIKRVVVGTTDPNPKHRGRGLKILRRAGIVVTEAGALRCDERTSQRAVPVTSSLHGRTGGSEVRRLSLHQPLADDCARLNESFNHWIVHHTPFVTVKAAMTVDGKIATAGGESKWITGEESREFSMRLRQGSDAILVGVNTILADDPSLTVRSFHGLHSTVRNPKQVRRIVLDSMARTPLTAKVVRDEGAALTTIVVSSRAPTSRIAALARRVNVLVAPTQRNLKLKNRNSRYGLRWLSKKLGAENVTSLLVEGGGEVNASFLLGGFAQRVAFFYAPKILGGRDARKAVAGDGIRNVSQAIRLREVEWRRLGEDLLLTARVD